jgi:1-acyl-sn-glycerol-3-phosphate acyltransferase
MNNFLRILFFIFIVKPLLFIFTGFNVFNKHNLPLNQQFILIANHNSHLDAVSLMNLFPLSQLHKIKPVAASDYFMKSSFLAWFSTTFLNILPIPREDFTKSNNPLTIMTKALEEGNSLIIFPEGSRGEPEKMENFKVGVAHIINKNPNIAVLPVFLKGMGRSLPKGELILVPFFCDVVIGKATFFKGTKNEITQQLEQAVKELSILFE